MSRCGKLLDLHCHHRFGFVYKSDTRQPGISYCSKRGGRFSLSGGRGPGISPNELRFEPLNRGTVPGSAGVSPASFGFRLPTGRQDAGAPRRFMERASANLIPLKTSRSFRTRWGEDLLLQAERGVYSASTFHLLSFAKHPGIVDGIGLKRHERRAPFAKLYPCSRTGVPPVSEIQEASVSETPVNCHDPSPIGWQNS